MTVDDVTRFTDGDCWLLMKRLHRLTGWRCYAFYCEGDPDPHVHGFVQVPDGRFLDVEGLHTEQEMLDAYRDDEDPDYFDGIKEFPYSEFSWATPEFGHYSYERARIVADELLDKLVLE